MSSTVRYGTSANIMVYCTQTELALYMKTRMNNKHEITEKRNKKKKKETSKILR